MGSAITYLVAARTAAATISTASVAITPEATLAGRRRRRRQRSSHDVPVDLLFNGLALRGQLVDRGLAAQVEPALAVDLDCLDHDLVADVGHFLGPLDTVVGQLRDV